MDATYTAPLAQRRPVAASIRPTAVSLGMFLVEVLKDGVRGHDFERAFTSGSGAQFAALPESSKQQMLNRGLRP